MYKLHGLKDVEKAFNEKLKEIHNATLDSMNEASDYLLEKARPLAPIDTGKLRKSGKVSKKGTNRYVIKRSIYFQAFSENGYDYAIIQHENLYFNHPRGGQAKYLEQPFNEEQDNMIKIIGKGIKEVL